MSLESDGGVTLTGENRRTRRKTCPSATLSTTNPTWIEPGRELNSVPLDGGNRGISVSIAFAYGLDDRAIEVRFPAEAKVFFV
jgi:hypothetical protein